MGLRATIFGADGDIRGIESVLTVVAGEPTYAVGGFADLASWDLEIVPAW